MSNPFTMKVISGHESFCNRIKEQDDFLSYAKSNTNAVLYSPRRYGKTSLIKQVQRRIAKDKNRLTVYVDFFGLSSVDDIAARIAKGLYSILRSQKSLLEKAVQTISTFRPVIRPTEQSIDFTIEQISPTVSGIQLLDKTMEDFGKFLNSSSKSVNITFDEFQEISELKESLQVEGILRKHIQEHKASYFFVGSRRRLLLDIFNERTRPFYQSALNYRLARLPTDEFNIFIRKAFENSEKICSRNVIASIIQRTSNHPYYTQKLAFFVFEEAETTIEQKHVEIAFSLLMQSEAVVFEAILQGLAPQQIALLKALAKDPSPSVLSNQYMQSHGLKSIGGIQSALKRLVRKDLIEREKNGPWQLVDPILKEWLKDIS
jgi:uncharacterized protein